MALAVWTLGFMACGNASKTGEGEVPPPPDSTGKVCLPPSDRNPNGASELAQLMRTMETQTETWKKEITDNKAELSPVPDAYAALKTALPTEPEMKNENYDGFADDFLNYANTLVKAPKAERQTAFNSMVGGCMSCHSQMCPGP
eukprot:gene42151-52259_t